MTSDERLVQLTQREVELLLRYAYPFEAEAAKLRACKPRRVGMRFGLGLLAVSLIAISVIRSGRRAAPHFG